MYGIGKGMVRMDCVGRGESKRHNREAGRREWEWQSGEGESKRQNREAGRGNRKGRTGNGNDRTRNGSLPLTALISSIYI
jgi:hypothetical protein